MEDQFQYTSLPISQFILTQHQTLIVSGQDTKKVDAILHHSVELNCEVRKAFEMFTVNRLLEPWLILPYGGSHADIEPFLGGKYELFWDKKNRDRNSTIGCRITLIEPNKLLSFEWKGPPEFAAVMNNDPLTHVTVVFFPQKNGTEVHLVHSGWGTTAEWQRAREWFRKSWQSAFQKLSARSQR